MLQSHKSPSIRLLLSVIASLSFPGPSSALDFYEERGGWSIVGDTSSCIMLMDYEGPGATQVSIIKWPDRDGIGIGVTNTNWTAKKNEEYEVAFVLNGVEYGGRSFGTADYPRAGFLTLMSPSFERHFAEGSSLHIYLSEQRIDQLSLAGTAVAIASVNRCIAAAKAELAADRRERERWEHLPKDPFAGRAASSADAGEANGEVDIAAPVRAAQAAHGSTDTTTSTDDQ